MKNKNKKDDLLIGRFTFRKGKLVHQRGETCLSKRRGFTLIELLIVIAIIGILSGVVLVLINNAKERAKEREVLSKLRSAMSVIQMCSIDRGVLGNYAAGYLCCKTLGSWWTSTFCVDGFGAKKEGYTQTWPVIGNQGWVYVYPNTGSLAGNNYVYKATKGGKTITCSLSTGSCVSN